MQVGLQSVTDPRYLDLRYSVMPTVQMEANDISFEDFDKRHSICDQVVLDGHGILRGSRFCDTVDQIGAFVAEHPREFIVLKLQEESFRLNTLAKHILVRKLEETLGDALVRQVDVDWWFRLESVTLDLIWSHGKSVLLVFRKEIYADLNRSEFVLGKADPRKLKRILAAKPAAEKTAQLKALSKKLAQKGLHHKKYFLLDRWHDTDDPHTLVASMEAFLREKKGVSEQLKVLQVILTNQRNIWNHVKKFYAKGLISIEKLCEKLHRDEVVSEYLLEGLHEHKFQLGGRE